MISGGNLIFPRPVILVAMIALLAMLAARQVHIKPQGRVSVIIGLLAAILVVSLTHTDLSALLPTLIRFANFAAGLMLLQLYLRTNQGQLAVDLRFLLKPMTAQAILTPILALVAAPLFLPITVQETTYQSFLVLFNYHVTLEDAAGLVRPDGLFYEPGVFQIYLNLYLYLVLFVFREWRRAPMAVLAVLATQSTTGILIAILQLAYAALHVTRRLSLRRKLPALIAAGLVAIPIGLFAARNVASKLTGDFQGSSMARQYDLLTGLSVIAENPLLGIGFDHNSYKEIAGRLGYQDTELDEHLTADRGNTNGVIFLCYSIGIPLAFPFLWGIFNQQFFTHRLLVGIILLLSFMSESMIFTPFFLLIIFSGLSVKRSLISLTKRALTVCAL
jgi:O-Antigen ligase